MVGEFTEVYRDDMGHQSVKPDLGEVGVFCCVCRMWSDGQSDRCSHCRERLVGDRPLTVDSATSWVEGQIEERRTLGIPVPAEDQELLHRWAAHESTTIGTSVWNPSNKTVVAVSMSIAALIVVGALALGWSPLRNAGSPTRPVGAVTTVELSQAFVTDPCAALERYHGRWFRITGTVLPADQWGRWPPSAIPLESGKHTGGGLSCQGKVLFGVQTVEEAVLLERDIGVRIDADGALDLVCRIHLAGWGAFDYSPQIWAYDCQEPD